MLYIVHVRIQKDEETNWAKWMKDIHIPEVLETGCFDWAIMNRDEAADTDTHAGYRFTYKASSEASFADYEKEHAAALRDDHTTRYEGKFLAHRELLPTEAFWSAP